MLGTALIIISILIVGIWILLEVRRLKHKLWAIAMIAFVLFAYVSFTITLKGKNIDYQSVSGLSYAGKIYFSWLSGIFGNMKTITGNAINMNWGANESSSKK